MRWRDKAACAQAVTDGLAQWEDWFADTDEGRTLPLVICRSCPVTAECLRWRDRVKATHGIWGGIPLQGAGRHKTCQACGELFARREGERVDVFNRRMYCGPVCARQIKKLRREVRA